MRSPSGSQTERSPGRPRMVARRELTNVLSFSERRRHVMKTSTSVKRSPLIFFVLVFALSLLFWLLGPLAEHFSLELPALRGGAQILPVNVLVGTFVRS